MSTTLFEDDPVFEKELLSASRVNGLFCKPTCPEAGKSQEETEQISGVAACLLKGYLPCRLCNPAVVPGQTPPETEQLIKELSTNPSVKFREYDLKKRGIDPAKLRAWFLRQHGITFHSYQRMLRINSAFRRKKRIENYSTPPLLTEEPSGDENGAFSAVFGVAPADGKKRGTIILKRIETPLGTMIACSTEKGLSLLEFGDRRMLETELKSLVKIFNANIIQGESELFNEVEKQLGEYFAGSRKEFSIPLDTPGTPFQEKVWEVLQTIPYGTTRSYLAQAEAIGNPGSVRAVAGANGMNRVSIIIPCHRVIGSDGKLTGYGGGLWRKQYLLELEREHAG